MDNTRGESYARSIIFPGRFESLAKIGEFVTRAAEEAGFDAREVYAVQLAVDEACSNIIEHAYGGENRGAIECTCRVVPEALIIILQDRGRPFDPEGVPEPNLDASLEERQGGNLGLYFMRQLMDEVRFERKSGSFNVLTMVKRREVTD
ncbi:MAG: ATP-binding protein [Anaerolineae bacterium]|jgi:serine/threonine-protein kinase RsbW